MFGTLWVVGLAPVIAVPLNPPPRCGSRVRADAQALGVSRAETGSGLLVAVLPSSGATRVVSYSLGERQSPPQGEVYAPVQACRGTICNFRLRFLDPAILYSDEVPCCRRAPRL